MHKTSWVLINNQVYKSLDETFYFDMYFKNKFMSIHTYHEYVSIKLNFVFFKPAKLNSQKQASETYYQTLNSIDFKRSK